jgi:hypothetical protein
MSFREWFYIVLIVAMIASMVNYTVGTIERNKLQNQLYDNLKKLMDVNLKQEEVIDKLLVRINNSE